LIFFVQYRVATTCRSANAILTTEKPGTSRGPPNRQRPRRTRACVPWRWLMLLRSTCLRMMADTLADDPNPRPGTSDQTRIKAEAPRKSCGQVQRAAAHVNSRCKASTNFWWAATRPPTIDVFTRDLSGFPQVRLGPLRRAAATAAWRKPRSARCLDRAAAGPQAGRNTRPSNTP
jgi:hypothetical protein